ncbi:MAG: membrane integrity-associated transporter subunit PqiC [Planctomycetes bacterium]|nr:membrane integrity-associated transporter subunit PqiC [Planctomycetota bacterium]
MAALLLAAASGGCRNTSPPIEEFLLAPLPPSTLLARPADGVAAAAPPSAPADAPADAPAAKLPALRVRPLTARSFLDRREIAWREGDVRAGPYHYRRWSEPPAEAVTRQLIAALRARGRFAQVEGSSLGGAPLTLRGELLGLHEESGADGSDPHGVAALELCLEAATRDGVPQLFTASRRVAAADDSMEALVEAISAALAALLEELLPQVEAAAQARA